MKKLKIIDDLEPQDPAFGPPLPKALHAIWPPDLRGPPGSLAYRAQSYAAGVYRTAKVPPEEIVRRAKKWLNWAMG